MALYASLDAAAERYEAAPFSGEPVYGTYALSLSSGSTVPKASRRVCERTQSSDESVK